MWIVAGRATLKGRVGSGTGVGVEGGVRGGGKGTDEVVTIVNVIVERTVGSGMVLR